MKNQINMKRLTTLIIISNLFLLGELKAQFNVTWASDYQHTTSSGYSNEGREVVTDTIYDFVYTLNDVKSDLDPNGVVTGQGYSYVVLAKYDASGNLIDNVTIDVGLLYVNGFEEKSGFGLQVDPSGNVYIGYNSYTAATNFDINLAKYNNQLNLVWSYKFNAITEDLGIAMEVNNGTSFAILKSSGGGTSRSRIIKASGSGTSAIPLYTYSNQPDYLSDLTVDATQKIYTTGYRIVAGSKAILMSCVNSLGTLLWSKIDNCGTVTGDDFSRDINLGYDGYLYITGSSQGTVQHGVDALIMKFNPTNGKKMWESFINVNLTDGGFFVINPDPNYVFAAWSALNSVFIDQISAADGTQIRRVSYAPIPVVPYNSLTGATISDMKMSKRQNIYLTGGVTGISGGQNFSSAFLMRASFSSRGVPNVNLTLPVTGNPAASLRGTGVAFDESNLKVYLLEDESDTYTTHADERVWLLSVSVPGTLRMDEDGTESGDAILNIETSPNPVSNELHIRSNTPINKIEISDINGKLLLSENVTESSEAHIDFSKFSGGMYLVKVYDNTGNSTMSKIIK